MKISIIGTGYVGLISGVGLADCGHDVTCVDVFQEKVDLINSKKAPIFEDGLIEKLELLVPTKLCATTDLKNAIKNSDITFICVGTPSNDDDSIDLSFIKEASKQVGKAISEKNSFHTIVVKSTVVSGTTENVVLPLIEQYSNKKEGISFGICMNPEFLKEGTAIKNFKNPDRIVIGTLNKKTKEVLKEVYSSFSCPFLFTDPKTAEMIKYTANSFLATKISFINEIGNLCKKLKIDTYTVAEGIGLDYRISPKFLKSGIGFGGSCFPKDVKALYSKSLEEGENPILLKAVLEVNKNQPFKFIELVKKKALEKNTKKLSILGLAFKNGTDDIRESAAIVIVNELIKDGFELAVFDPEAMKNAKRVFGETVQYCSDKFEAIGFSDVVLVLTEWSDFKDNNLFKGKLLIDGRRIFKNVPSEQEYEGICW